MRSARFAVVTLFTIAMAANAGGQSVPWLTRVRLVTDTGTVEGRIESVDSATYRLRIKDDYQSFRRTEVSSVFQYTTLSGKGAGTGAIVGALMLGRLGAAMCDTPDGCKGDVAVAAGVGGIGGALIGAMIGSAVTRWTRLPAQFEVRYANTRAHP